MFGLQITAEEHFETCRKKVLIVLCTTVLRFAKCIAVCFNR